MWWRLRREDYRGEAQQYHRQVPTDRCNIGEQKTVFETSLWTIHYSSAVLFPLMSVHLRRNFMVGRTRAVTFRTPSITGRPPPGEALRSIRRTVNAKYFISSGQTETVAVA
ncbi:hypothetical protein J6590_034662 [Homalodisca vitripennis]|nr:hypothetical protein J6590_034662 [Homalodisca vitripennis]